MRARPQPRGCSSVAAKKIGDLARGGLRRVRAVHDVLLDALGEVGADRARGGLLRVGRAHDLAVARDGVLALQHLHDDRAGGHVAHQILEERALAMHGVETLRLELRQVAHARGDDRQAGLLKAAIDLADEIGPHAVGLDDGQGALERHSRDLSRLKWSWWKSGPVDGQIPAVARRSARREQAAKSTLAHRPPATSNRSGSAGLVRLFCMRPEDQGWPRDAPAAQTEKLSPQPHSPFTFGLRKRKASFSPCFTKSTIVPSSSPRLAASTNTLHAAVLEDRVPGLRAVRVIDDVGKAGAAGLAHAQPQADAMPACGEKALDPVGGGFSQRDGHQSSYCSASGPVREAARSASSTTSSRPSFSTGTAARLRPLAGVAGDAAARVCGPRSLLAQPRGHIQSMRAAEGLKTCVFHSVAGHEQLEPHPGPLCRTAGLAADAGRRRPPPREPAKPPAGAQPR